MTRPYDADAINRANPDGGETMPTTADYVRFKTWIAATFGPGALERYYGADEDLPYDPGADDPVNNGGWDQY